MIEQKSRPVEATARARLGPIVIEMADSYESAEALRWAADLSRLFDSELVATCTWHPGIGEFRPAAHEAVVQRLTTDLRSWCALAGDVGVTPSVRVVEGDWPQALVHDSQTTGAALIVTPIAVSPSPTSSASESTARQLLQRSTTPVALVPVSGANRCIRRVLVATPDGVSSRNLIEWVTTVAVACAATVHIVSVLPVAPEWVSAADPNSMWQVERRTRTTRWAPLLESKGVAHQIHVVEGNNPVDAWARTARQLHADVILVGADRRGGIGSVLRATALVHLARDTGLAVIVVPTGSGTRDD